MVSIPFIPDTFRLWYKAPSKIDGLKRSYKTFSLPLWELDVLDEGERIGHIHILSHKVRGSLNQEFFEDEKKALEISDCFEEYRLKDRNITITHFSDLKKKGWSGVLPSISREYYLGACLGVSEEIEDVRYMKNIILETYNKVCK